MVQGILRQTQDTALSPSVSSARALTIRPHRGQWEFLRAEESTVAAVAGTGGGKSVGGMVAQMMDLVGRPGQLWLAAEPTWPMVERILLRSSEGRPGLVDVLRYIDPGAIYRKSDQAIYTRYGTVFLASASDPQTMEGVHVAGVWLDEAGQMSKLAYETAVRRASYLAGRVRITTTPYNRGWLYRDVYLPWREGNPDIRVVQFSSLANPKYPTEVFERNRRSMDPARFRMMHEGGFERPEGMIYEVWDDSMIVDPFDVPEEWRRVGGLDYGYNHPTGAPFLVQRPDGVWFLYNEYRESGTLMSEHYRGLMDRCGSEVPVWYDDPAGAQYSAEMRRLGLPTVAADNEVLAGIDTVATLMAQGRLRVFRTCTKWLDEVESYVWDKSPAGEFIDKPRKENDDLMDATRYALHSAEKRSGLKLFI